MNLEAVTRISAPLALAGFILILLSLLLRQVIVSWIPRRPASKRSLEYINRAVVILAALATMAGFTGYVITQVTPARSSGPEMRKIQLNLIDKPLLAVLQECAKQANVNLVVVNSRLSEATNETITIDANGSLSPIMDAICEAQGCNWKLEGDRLIVTIKE